MTYGEKLAAEVIQVIGVRPMDEKWLAALLDTAHYAGRVDQVAATLRPTLDPEQLRATGAL
jgi:hypothetical protein